MRVLLGEAGSIDIDSENQDTLELMTGHTEQRQLCAAVRASFRHLKGILSQKEADPLLDDVDAWLAAVLIDHPLPTVDVDRLSQLSEAWEDAEATLSIAARLALRATGRLLERVFAAPDKATFVATAPAIVGDLDDETASLCAAYLHAIREEKRPSRAEASRQHYLQRRLHRLRLQFCDPATESRGRQWVVKRLAAAEEAVAPAAL